MDLLGVKEMSMERTCKVCWSGETGWHDSKHP